MNLTEYRAKRDVIEKMVKDFSFIVPGCQQCKHFEIDGKCGANNHEAIPTEFLRQREECDAWEHDGVPF